MESITSQNNLEMPLVTNNTKTESLMTSIEKLKMPAAIKDLRAGDMVLHRGKPMYVQSVEENGIHCIDILNSENKVIVPVTNMFGFNFVTKVVSLMNFNAAQPSAENPFGNLMPFMMMSSVMSDDSDNDFSKMMMMGGSNPFTTMFTPQDK